MQIRPTYFFTTVVIGMILVVLTSPPSRSITKIVPGKEYKDHSANICYRFDVEKQDSCPHTL